MPKNVMDEHAALRKKALELLFVFDGTSAQASLLKNSADLFRGKFKDQSILTVKAESLPGEIVRVKEECDCHLKDEGLIIGGQSSQPMAVYETHTSTERIADPDHYDESFASLQKRILAGQVRGSVVYVGDGGADGVNVPPWGEVESLIDAANTMGVSLYFIYLDDAGADKKQYGKLLNRRSELYDKVNQGEASGKDIEWYAERMDNVNPDPSNQNHRRNKYRRLCERTGGAMFELEWPTDEETLAQAMLELQELVRTPPSLRAEKIANMQLRKPGAGQPDYGAREGQETEGEVLESRESVYSKTVPAEVRRSVVRPADGENRERAGKITGQKDAGTGIEDYVPKKQIGGPEGAVQEQGGNAAYAFSPFISSYFDNFRHLRVDYSFSYGGETISLDAKTKKKNAAMLEKAESNLEQIMGAVRANLETFSAKTPAEILYIIDKTLFEDLGYAHERGKDMEFMEALSSKRLDCDTAGMIYYEIGQRIGYPISLGIVYLQRGQHSIPIWGEGKGRTLWEAHTDAQDKVYANEGELMSVLRDQGNPPISGLVEFRPSLILAINHKKFAQQTSLELQNRYGPTEATSESYLALMRQSLEIDPDNVAAYVELGRDTEAIEAARRLGGEKFAEQQRRKILEYRGHAGR